MPNEVFNDDMSESEVIDAFMNAANEQTEEKAEETPTEPTVPEESSAPTETNEMEQPPAEAVTATDETVSNEPPVESTSDVLDFSKPVMLKDRDMEFPANSSKELIDLARMGLNFTRKTQELSKHRGTIDYLDQQGITMADLQAMAEAKTGNKEALGHIAKNAGVDTLDIDPESAYNPNDAFAPRQYSEVDTVALELQNNPEVVQGFQTLMEYVPNSFKDQLATDARVLKGFGVDVESGLAKELVPEAVKLHALHGGDFVQHYVEAGRRYAEAQTPAQQQEAPQETAPASPNRAKAGVSSSTSTGVNSGGFDVWSATDAELMDKINSISKH